MSGSERVQRWFVGCQYSEEDGTPELFVTAMPDGPWVSYADWENREADHAAEVAALRALPVGARYG